MEQREFYISNRCIPGFLNFGTIDVLDQIIFLVGIPVNCRIFSNIPDLYPLGISSKPHDCDKQMLPNAPWEANSWDTLGEFRDLRDYYRNKLRIDCSWRMNNLEIKTEIIRYKYIFPQIETNQMNGPKNKMGQAKKPNEWSI